MNDVEFSNYAAASDDELDLLTGALLIARDATPGLDLDAQREKLDRLAEPLERRQAESLAPRLQARLLSDYLYVVCGFHGAESDYYDPRNSFVNDVLDRRTGIPISLAVVYIEVARRVGVEAHGVGFPGHFLVRVGAPAAEEADGPVVVDPFNRGKVLGTSDLNSLLTRAKVKAPLSREMLAPAPARHILARMLMNLRGIYTSRADLPRLLLTLDRLIDLMPSLTDELLERAKLHARLGAPRAARADLERYLELDGADAQEARALLERLGTARALN